MKHLYFVRHGLSVMNNTGIFSGRTDTPLHPTGIIQATAAGQELQSASVDYIVTSPLQRAWQTATIIAHELNYPENKILTSELLTERDFGPLEGTPYQPDLGESDGVETIDAILKRAGEAYKLLQSLDAETIVVVSHGSLGRALRSCIDPSIPFKPSAGFENAKVVKLI